jgi:hypothetical protein
VRNKLGYIGKLQESGHGTQGNRVKKTDQWGKNEVKNALIRTTLVYHHRWEVEQ